MNATQDKNGNPIGGMHVEYDVLDLSKYGVEVSISKADTTESVYVYYRRGEKTVTVRFSNHSCNAVKFGDTLDGHDACEDEIMYGLGLMNRTFIPSKKLLIGFQQVKKTDVEKYEEAELTIQEMYALGAGADLSPYKGKLAKGSRYLIFSDTVKEYIETKKNWMGNVVEVGNYEYEIKEEFKNL